MRSFLVLLLVVVFVGCEPAGDGRAAAASPAAENPLDPDAGDSAAPFVEVESAEALAEAIRAVDADIVLVNYWATWCGPCRVEFPELMRYDADKEAEGIEVRFVSVDMPADGALVQEFLNEQGLTEPSFLYIGPGELIGQFDPEVAGVVPVTMVFDDEGTLLKSHLGMLTYEKIDQLVAEATST